MSALSYYKRYKNLKLNTPISISAKKDQLCDMDLLYVRGND